MCEGKVNTGICTHLDVWESAVREREREADFVAVTWDRQGLRSS